MPRPLRSRPSPAALPLALGLLSLLLSLAACTNQVVLPARPMLECPEPVALCMPGRFDAVRVDTSSDGPTYLEIERVENLDTEVDEFGVMFAVGRAPATEAFATVRQSATDALVVTTFPYRDEAAIGRRLEDRNDGGSVGGGARIGHSDTILFTARRSGTLRGDYDLFSGLARATGLAAPLRLPQSALRYWDAQAALSPAGDAIYFASDRPGGYGGVDLYVSRLLGSGEWSAPENLGPAVNTPCDELTPFASGDGRWLYFSSSGHTTVGGYDLFRAPLLGQQIGAAENLGRPINTKEDEIFPGAPADASPDTLLYYGSNQAGSRRFDVYVLHRVRSARATSVALRSAEPVLLTGTVFDASGRPVDSAHVRIEQKDPPGGVDSTRTNIRGEFGFTIREGRLYEITAGSTRSLYSRETVEVPTSNTASTVRRDLVLPDTVTFRINFPFNNSTDPYEFTLDDRGLPTSDRWTAVMDRTAEFLRRLSRDRGARVVVVGHTDPVGTDAFNQGLGSRRAEFVRRALIERGVPAALLQSESRGESQPLPSTTGEPQDLYHARLRRVELIYRAGRP